MGCECGEGRTRSGPEERCRASPVPTACRAEKNAKERNGSTGKDSVKENPPEYGKPKPIVDKNGCTVEIIRKTVSIYDTDGKLLRQESIIDYTKENIRGESSSMEMPQWSQA